jgi:hypothetical protein
VPAGRLQLFAHVPNVSRDADARPRAAVPLPGVAEEPLLAVAAE